MPAKNKQANGIPSNTFPFLVTVNKNNGFFNRGLDLNKKIPFFKRALVAAFSKTRSPLMDPESAAERVIARKPIIEALVAKFTAAKIASLDLTVNFDQKKYILTISHDFPTCPPIVIANLENNNTMITENMQSCHSQATIKKELNTFNNSANTTRKVQKDEKVRHDIDIQSKYTLIKNSIKDSNKANTTKLYEFIIAMEQRIADLKYSARWKPEHYQKGVDLERALQEAVVNKVESPRVSASRSPRVNTDTIQAITTHKSNSNNKSLMQIARQHRNQRFDYLFNKKKTTTEKLIENTLSRTVTPKPSR